MKPISTTKNFDKAFAKRIGRLSKLRENYISRVSLFQTGERGYPINDHSLTGPLAGRRAFSVTNDIRVIYTETETEIIFLDVGTHNQVY